MFPACRTAVANICWPLSPLFQSKFTCIFSRHFFFFCCCKKFLFNFDFYLFILFSKPADEKQMRLLAFMIIQINCNLSSEKKLGGFLFQLIQDRVTFIVPVPFGNVITSVLLLFILLLFYYYYFFFGISLSFSSLCLFFFLFNFSWLLAFLFERRTHTNAFDCAFNSAFEVLKQSKSCYSEEVDRMAICVRWFLL